MDWFRRSLFCPGNCSKFRGKCMRNIVLKFRLQLAPSLLSTVETVVYGLYSSLLFRSEHADEDEGVAAAEEEDGHGAYNEDELFLGDLAKSSKFLAESEECEEQKREVLAVDVSSTVGNKHATSVSSTFGASRRHRDKRRRRRTDDDD
ncbi:hypothetical protein FOZ63_019599 [Perkinsus olseni]|uniref:Uncharacterized protein n=1 Tax=Perkinsus olseni TaxID=32597 RepID=A0A7J6RTS4_PEROL|nr:hypothetical protein FOZ63_019599 [Perkinsus olseni]